MKRIISILFTVLFIAGCIDPVPDLEPECTFDEYYVETSSRSAQISFAITVPEDLAIYRVGVAVSRTDDPSTDPDAVVKNVRLSSERAYSFSISDLEPETEYHYQAFASQMDETTFLGPVEKFTTLAAKILSGREFVNLGLASGTKWAAFNVDLESEKGYFPWTDLAAYVEDTWGGLWRLPTKEDWNELMSDCFWSWDVQGGMNGMLIRGSNGNTIFLPADGYKVKGYMQQFNEYGAYWTADAVDSTPGSSWLLFFGMDFVYWYPFDQSYCGSARPVNNANIYDYE